MSQDDQTVDNADGATVRADINSNLQALASSSSGASAPSPTWPNQFWFDTTADQQKQRDEANTAWVILGGLVGSVWTPWFEGEAQGPWSKKTAVVVAKSAGFSVIGADDGKLFECDVSGGGFTVSPQATATLGDGFLFGIKTTGHATNAVTIDPAGAEQIEGTTTRDVSGEGAVEWFRCTGSKFVLTADAALAGTVLQVVESQETAVDTGSTPAVQDDTIPQNDEGDEFMTLAITPKNSGSRLKIEVLVHGAHTQNGNQITALFVDSVADALAASHLNIGATNRLVHSSLMHDLPSVSTAARTYKVRIGGPAAGTFTFNGFSGGREHGGVLTSSIIITEYMP